jgi:septal ring factor EnvC (AmiA/AmiB activator)
VKKLISYALVFVLCASVVTLGAAYANEQQQLNEIHSKIDKSRSQLQEGKKKEKQLGDQIKKLESQINETEREIKDR